MNTSHKVAPSPDRTARRTARNAAGSNAHSLYWIVRGILVGLGLGASAGSIVPLFGTVIGGLGGSAAGLLIGLAMALFAGATRTWFPATDMTIQNRERIACLVIIWSPLLAFPNAAQLLAVPALIGSIHALAAGTPTKGAIYAGSVSEDRRKFCMMLPVAILGIIAVGWTVALTVGKAF
jgi:hypothetical protein